MFFNKKGVEHGLLLGLFILVIVAVILLGTSTPLFGDISNAADDSTCKTWVNLQAKYKAEGIRVIPSDNPCVTHIDIIKNKEEKEFYSDIAKKSYSCFDKYGAGKVDFFSDWDFTGIENYCLVCSEITIGEDVKVDFFDLDKFELYLSNNKIPGGSKTYSDYFTDAENSRIDFGNAKVPLKQGDKLYISYNIIKSRNAPDLLTGFVDTVKKTFINVGVAIIGSVYTFGKSGVKGSVLLAVVYSGFEDIFRANYMYPGLSVSKADEVANLGCSYHFNPKEKFSIRVNKDEEKSKL